jgi:outer membrane immunogenic protein
VNISTFFAGCALVGTSLFGNAAIAADMPLKALPPPVPVFSWTGCYAGLNGGYGWGSNHGNAAPSPDPTSQAFWSDAFTAGAAPSLYSYTNSGGLAGGQVGCNYQIGRFVVGFETDIDWANLSGSQGIDTPGGIPFPRAGIFSAPGFFSSGSDLHWLGTTRARVGFTPINQLLLYATGGVAYGNTGYNLSAAFPATNDFQSISASNTQAGWTAGAGVEWAFYKNWSVKAEYLYVDLGNQSFVSVPAGRAPNLGTSWTESFSNRYNIVRVGVNYKFNWPGPLQAKY